MEQLLKIQERLKAPKNQYNNHGKFNYRSCEDILEGVKPLLKELGCILLISDDIINIGKFNYIKATAKLINIEGTSIECIGVAKEAEIQKGMQSAQLSGSTSSYARKYALNGLFAIDDTKDSDTGTTYQAPEPVKAEPTLEEYVKYANNLYAQVKEPNDKMKQWIAQVQTYDIAEVKKGINKINASIKKQLGETK